jgi:hypothetical protein
LLGGEAHDPADVCPWGFHAFEAAVEERGAVEAGLAQVRPLQINAIQPGIAQLAGVEAVDADLCEGGAAKRAGPEVAQITPVGVALEQ